MPVSRHDLVLPVAAASLARAVLLTDCLFVHPPRDRTADSADGS